MGLSGDGARRRKAGDMDQMSKPWEQGELHVTENGRYFSCGEVPLFWMGDTAWLLFHQLTLEESYRYLRNRKEKGYNIILADFVHTPKQTNQAGDSALIEGDFSKINLEGSFWTHIDKVMDMAEELGLYMGILPVWGSSIVKGGHLNGDNIQGFMEFVLNRYHHCPNLVWIAGGDVRGDVATEVFRTMGRMMKADRPERMVGYHPFGRTSSSLWFHDEEWLDFNLFQSGHRRYDQVELGAWDDNTKAEGCFGEDCWRYVERDLAKTPGKPTLDGEPSYEQVLQGLHDKTQPYWMAADARRYAYWSVLAGAGGHTYGHNSIMQFYGDKTKEGAYGAKYTWDEAIHHPGGSQMQHLAELMNSVDFVRGRAAQEYLLSEQGKQYQYISVFAGPGYIFAYTYTGREISLSLKDYRDRLMDAYWFDPVTGVSSFIGEMTGRATVTMLPPERETGTDMVLVLRER